MNDLRVVGVVIDAGHGGSDPGAVNGNIKEKDFNLEVSQYMFDRFKQLGVPATLTRDSDETLDRNTRVSRILNAYGNDPGVIVISNHINAGGGEGAEVVYALRNNSTLAREVLENIGAAGQKTRKYYQRRLPEDTSKDYYFIQRLTGRTQPLLVEYGFIDNAQDLRKLQNYIKDYGEGVVKAVTEYLGYPYTPPVQTPTNRYTVKAGDTLYSIANRLNVTVDELKRVNNLTSNTLTIGQTLIIPGSEEPIPQPTPPVSDYVNYTVKAGDSLYKIANQFGVSVNDIIEFNKLPSTVLSIGQQLLIPTSNGPSEETPTPSEGQYYTVQPGDSLYKIANQFGVTVDDIIRANNMTSTVLQIGEQLFIPTGEVVEEPSDTISYTVKAGDSLYSIARNYGTTVNEIRRLNNLTSDVLSIGQTLIIPTQNDQTNYTTYTVKSGDNLYSIASRFNTNVDELKRLNGLTSNLLSIGQVLTIPS